MAYVTVYELSEYLQLSEEYILEAIEQYKKIYGIGTHYGEYSITFEPLRVLNIRKNINKGEIKMRKYNYDKFFLYMAVLSLPIVIFFPLMLSIPIIFFIFSIRKKED